MNGAVVGQAGRFFLIFFGLALPFLAYRARHRLTSLRPLPSRRRLYVSTLLQLTFFLVLALLAAWAERLSIWRWPEHVLVPSAVTAVLLVLMIISTRPMRRSAVERRELRVYFTMPTGPVERALWIALSLMAGIAEETVYRGVFSDLATRLTASMPLAWGLAVAAFAIAHANQGPRAVAVIAAFALGAHALVYFTGTLLYAILLHAIYDVVAGFDYARLGQQLGYPTRGLPDADAAAAVTTSPATSSP
ncbi:MAG: CPBP family intramembrane glutamic endopeptidase [Gemmatimonadaceae bacterium]